MGGLTPLVQRTSAGRSFALFAVVRDGLQLLEIKGNTTTTSGGYVVRMFVAGDANVDGAVDGLDATIVASHVYSNAADANGDGAVDASDLQLVASNTGFKANRAPVLTPASQLTHTDLRMRVDLSPQAVDNEGDAVYFQLVSASHGLATLNPDGHTVTFTPDLQARGAVGSVSEFSIDDEGNDYAEGAHMFGRIRWRPVLTLGKKQNVSIVGMLDLANKSVSETGGVFEPASLIAFVVYFVGGLLILALLGALFTGFPMRREHLHTGHEA